MPSQEKSASKGHSPRKHSGYFNKSLDRLIHEAKKEGNRVSFKLAGQVLWNSFTSFTNLFIRALIRRMNDVDIVENFFRKNAIDIGKWTDRSLECLELSINLCTHIGELIELFENLKKESQDYEVIEIIGAQLKRKIVTVGVLVNLLLQRHISLLRNYINLPKRADPKEIAHELEENGERLVKLFVLLGKDQHEAQKDKRTHTTEAPRSDECRVHVTHKEGKHVWGKYLGDVFAEIADENKHLHRDSTEAYDFVQNDSFSLSWFAYHALFGKAAEKCKPEKCKECRSPKSKHDSPKSCKLSDRETPKSEKSSKDKKSKRETEKAKSKRSQSEKSSNHHSERQKSSEKHKDRKDRKEDHRDRKNDGKEKRKTEHSERHQKHREAEKESRESIRWREHLEKKEERKEHHETRKSEREARHESRRESHKERREERASKPPTSQIRVTTKQASDKSAREAERKKRENAKRRAKRDAEKEANEGSEEETEEDSEDEKKGDTTKSLLEGIKEELKEDSKEDQKAGKAEREARHDAKDSERVQKHRPQSPKKAEGPQKSRKNQRKSPERKPREKKHRWDTE